MLPFWGIPPFPLLPQSNERLVAHSHPQTLSLSLSHFGTLLIFHAISGNQVRIPTSRFFACVPQPLFSKEYLYRMGHASGDLHDLLSFPELKKSITRGSRFLGGLSFKKRERETFFSFRRN